MEILNFPLDQFKVFILMFIRISVVLYLFPIFDSSMFPAYAKAGFCLVLTLLLFPAVNIELKYFPAEIANVPVLLVSELFVGMVLGLSVRIFFGAVQLAGQMISFQMGFSIINVLDVQTGSQVSIIDQIGTLVVVQVFLLLDGHHAFISALIESFKIVDFGILSLKKELLAQVLFLSSDMFVLAVKMGAPAIAALLFTSAVFGISAKFAPQMNILIAAFPVKIVVGLIFFGISLHIISFFTQSYLEHFPFLLTSLLKMIGGS